VYLGFVSEVRYRRELHDPPRWPGGTTSLPELEVEKDSQTYLDLRNAPPHFNTKRPNSWSRWDSRSRSGRHKASDTSWLISDIVDYSATDLMASVNARQSSSALSSLDGGHWILLKLYEAPFVRESRKAIAG
jgi:hypothetical protein